MKYSEVSLILLLQLMSKMFLYPLSNIDFTTSKIFCHMSYTVLTSGAMGKGFVTFCATLYLWSKA